MLLIDGVKYELWTPPSEDEFEQVVKEHAQEIFGEQSIYFYIKQKLESVSGIGSIPDGYAIVLAAKPYWYIVEIELSRHDVFGHIVPQVTKFTAGMKNPSSRQAVADAIYEEINRKEELRERVKSKVGLEIYKSLMSLVSQPPKLAIVIDEETEELGETVEALKVETDVIELRTFVNGGDKSRRAYLFEPLSRVEGQLGYNKLLTELRQELIDTNRGLKPRKPTNRYCYIPIKNHSKIHTEWLVWGDKGLRVELHLERANREENLHIFSKLKALSTELESKIGEELIFDDKWQKRGVRIYTEKKPMELTDEVKQWAMETMIKFYEVFTPLIDELDIN